MGKTLSETPIKTATARQKLSDGLYWWEIPGAHLGYRKTNGKGTWLVRWRSGTGYRQRSLDKPANDANDQDNAYSLTFKQAQELALHTLPDLRETATHSNEATVASIVRTYVADRDRIEALRRGQAVRSDANQRLSRYLLGQPARGRSEERQPADLARMQLTKLTRRDLRTWVEGLPADLKDTTKRRLINDLRAAFNQAVDERDDVPASLAGTVKSGLKFVAAAASVARDNQILEPDEIRRILAAARDVDRAHSWGGDLHRLIAVLAATGARFSQVVRLRVDQFQPSGPRLLMPSSRKGRRDKQARVEVVPIGQDVADLLVPAAEGRAGHEILLQRQVSEQPTGTIQWVAIGRGPWKVSAELRRPWAEIVERAELPGVIPYALRHSSIVRGIKANLPIQLVAATHDTSVQMIERHYAKWITTGLEQIARGAVIPLV